MAQLPTDHPIVTAIYQLHESKQGDWRRPHLGGSLLGDECERKLWYSFRWALAPSFGGRMLRLFETGQLEEDRFVKELRGIGCQVWEVDPDTGRQIRIKMAGGHAGGSLDGVAIDVPGSSKPHVVEMKTHNAKSFKELKQKGVEAAKPQHYAQMQIYGHKEGLPRFLYLAKNKDTDELYVERGHIKPSVGKQLEEKAERIVFSEEPLSGISSDPAFFKCKFCDYSPVCHGKKAPTVSCRSCAFVTPHQDGTWFCERHKTDLTTDDQKDACPDHLFNPSMMPLKVKEYDPDSHTMSYENGLINAAEDSGQGISSRSIEAAEDVRALDGNATAIVGKFDGSVVK